MRHERLKADRALTTTILPPPGVALAEEPGMTNQARKLSLVSNEDRDRPTEPHNLRPSDPHALSVTVPRMRPLPTELIGAIRALPPPNPDSYVEMSIALVLRGLENQQGIDTMLDSAVDRINADAEARRARATADINKNFEFTNHEVQNLASKVGQLDETVRELVPRMGKVETRLDDGAERFERIESTMGAMRAQMDRLETEVASLRGRIQDAATGPASTKTD